MKTFYLPDLGEGLAEGEIIKWHVAVGQKIQTDALLLSVETAKAIVDVPSPFTGTVHKLYAQAGDIVPTGGALIDVASDPSEHNKPNSSNTVAGEIVETEQIWVEQATALSPKFSGVKVLPAVRALAKKLQVDLSKVQPTGKDGTISADDVKKAVNQNQPAISDAQPLKGVRRSMALAMAQSHAQVVPVTIYDDVNISAWLGKKDLTTQIILAIVQACAAEPALNAWYDGMNSARSLQADINLGLAMDSVDGLFLPVMHKVQDQSAEVIRSQIDRLKQQVGDRTVRPADLQGATIVLSNFGKFAGRYANPIVVLPMVAILGVGALRQVPWVVEGQVTTAWVLPLSLSFDHRAVTGGEATRFLGALMQALQAP